MVCSGFIYMDNNIVDDICFIEGIIICEVFVVDILLLEWFKWNELLYLIVYFGKWYL